MFTLSWTIEKELELNLYIMQAQFDNKPSLSGYTLKTSGPLAGPWWRLAADKRIVQISKIFSRNFFLFWNKKPLEVSDNFHFLCTVTMVSCEQITKTRELPVENSSAGHS